jgi:hypothetical protein
MMPNGLRDGSKVIPHDIFVQRTISFPVVRWVWVCGCGLGLVVELDLLAQDIVNTLRPEIGRFHALSQGNIESIGLLFSESEYMQMYTMSLTLKSASERTRTRPAVGEMNRHIATLQTTHLDRTQKIIPTES